MEYEENKMDVLGYISKGSSAYGMDVDNLVGLDHDTVLDNDDAIDEK